jgi:hypothetical protein
VRAGLSIVAEFSVLIALPGVVQIAAGQLICPDLKLTMFRHQPGRPTRGDGYRKHTLISLFPGYVMTFSFPATQMRVSITVLELCYSSHSEYS